MLKIRNLAVARDQKTIISNFSLEVAPGSTHFLMGPNGSGKSTFAYTIMGHPAYEVISGTMSYKDSDLRALSVDKRAQSGIFLAFQQPIEIPGVMVSGFLKEAYQAIHKSPISAKEFMGILHDALDLLGMDYAFASRSLNESFSGGEKKRLELLQMLVLKPQLAILDEIDSGLDVDALKLIARVLDILRHQNPHFAVVCITHYHRLLTYVRPDYVHIIKSGAIVASSNADLARTIEAEGYDAF
ncbi:ABC transporter ATP-binding protein [Candidatus Dependentiae bacterium Noda2021]|nr:ABC transporter ATP-binding protein [Candidatus Dependentiae bacterium Noda2021]